jgi:hydrogenase maturation protein HypF
MEALVHHQLASHHGTTRERQHPDAGRSPLGVRIDVDGLVQGVGFRPWVYAVATAAGIGGRVWNHPSGVTIEAFGEPTALRVLVEQLEHPPMPAARVQDIRCQRIPYDAVESFEIVASRAGTDRRPSIPPDLALCDACRHELRDPTDRRYGYAFTNCTRCGPRYTIALDVPYDRRRTTMRAFPMCDACRREYADPGDRRFHAQPNACPVCGPQLHLVDTQGMRLADDPIAAAARLLRDGRIVAVKGLGGYHLACDATCVDAVATVRARKQRDAKPFAVMVPSLAAAERLAILGPAERDLLVAPSRPIVLATRRPGSGLAAAVAPGNPLVGLMLPYTPLHELLLAAAGRPLVMTSGNHSDEPMACGDDEALQRLGSIADAFVQHTREIANRCDDSVARVIAGRPVVLRRSRGWVPGSIRVAHRFPEPILACGAHLKNAFCLADGDRAWLGPHIGDLETHEACMAFETAVERFQQFVGITPAVIAHDLHPDYFSTRYALQRRAAAHVGVQHHHAHVASVMAEHGLDGPVIGLAWDGTGYGTDGTAWGGELLVADFAEFRRLASFRPIRLAGGDRAIREVWRSALALLDDAFDGNPPLDRLPVFTPLDPSRVTAARRMLTTGWQAPLAHGVGRYFDAFGAIVLGIGEARYEGQVAMQLTFAADARERRPYAFQMDEPLPRPLSEAERGARQETMLPPSLAGKGLRGVGFGAPAIATVDLRPAVRAAVADLLAGRSAGSIAGRFHATMAAAAVEMVRLAKHQVGCLPVVLSGGCFQNARLVEDLLAALAPRGRVYVHEQVPPNDGGIALGQAMVASARLPQPVAAPGSL